MESNKTPWEKDFHFESWGAACRAVLNTQPKEGEHFPLYRAVVHTAKLAACSMVIEASPPKAAAITVPNVTMALDENTTTAHGTWIVDFKTRGGSDEQHEAFFEGLHEKVEPPHTDFADQWMSAWLEREKEESDLTDVFDQSDRTLGMWVYGAMCAYLKVGKDMNIVRAAMFQDTATHWIARTIKAHRQYDVCLLPGPADLVIQQANAVANYAFPMTLQ